MNYTVDEFVEIIRDIEGVTYVRQEVRRGYPIIIMQCSKGMVIIDREFEDLEDEIGMNYLRSLDIEFMIGALFPMQ